MTTPMIAPQPSPIGPYGSPRQDATTISDRALRDLYDRLEHYIIIHRRLRAELMARMREAVDIDDQQQAQMWINLVYLMDGRQ